MLRNIFFLIVLATFTFACGDDGPIGPEGPRGPQGEPGLDGRDGEEAFSFDFNVTFTAPDYRAIYVFPDNFELREFDVVLVYALWEVQVVDGQDVLVWRQLPQTIVDNNGILQYNFDFTLDDVSVFMEGDYDLSVLGPEFTDDWLMQAVVVPTQSGQNGRFAADYSDFYDVVERFNLKVAPVPDRYKDMVRPPVE